MRKTQKADILFTIAMEKMTLLTDNSNVKQSPCVLDLDLELEFDSNYKSPYICDNVDRAFYKVMGKYITDSETFEIQKELADCGMLQSGFGVWNHVEPTRRQEARWFFLMMIVEFLDREKDD